MSYYPIVLLPLTMLTIANLWSQRNPSHWWCNGLTIANLWNQNNLKYCSFNVVLIATRPVVSKNRQFKEVLEPWNHIIEEIIPARVTKIVAKIWAFPATLCGGGKYCQEGQSGTCSAASTGTCNFAASGTCDVSQGVCSANTRGLRPKRLQRLASSDW